MPFINIKDPKKRDAIVAEYLATVKRHQDRGITERAQDLTGTEEINRVLEPVVRSTAKSTEAIAKELIPIREEIQVLNDRITAKPNLEKEEAEQQQQQQQQHEEEVKQPESNIVQLFYQKLPEEKLDKYFGIVPDGEHHYKMGKTRVQIDGSDILIDDTRYKGSKGLWSLIMRRVPSDFSHEDLITYRDLVLKTNAMAYPNNLRPGSNVKSTKKWRKIFPLFDTLDEDSPNSSEQETGEGIIQFLPGDIKGLETKLNYLLAEYRAGNRLSILGELMRRRKISRKEYKYINTFLQ